MRAVLALLFLVPIAAADESVAEWQKLLDSYKAAQQQYWKDWAAAKQADAAAKLDYSQHPDRTFPARFREFAETHQGTDGAAHALAQVFRLGPDQAAKDWALPQLLATHIKSTAMKDVAWSLRYYRGDADAALTRISEKCPHPESRGLALLVLGMRKKADQPRAAVEFFERVRSEYGDQPYFSRMTLAKKAEGEIFEATQLSVGKEAPEILGSDVDGTPFKLSDYRGKVVVLDFWGDW